VRPLVLFALALAGCAAPVEETADTDSAVEGRGDSERYTLEIAPDVRDAIDEPKLRATIVGAIARYEQAIAPLTAPIAVAVGTAGCLRTGYDFTGKRVVFCERRDTPKVGTASEDVVRHELFHAMLCQSRPETCTKESLESVERTALHEGLADYFAYSLAPDASFGEGFYAERPFVRAYETSLCHSLVDGAHEKGNTIASALVRRRTPLAGLAPFAKGGAFAFDGRGETCFAADGPQVEATIEGYPTSRLGRYKIERDRPLGVTFYADEAFAKRFGALRVRFSPEPKLFKIEETGANAFRVTVTGESGFDKVFATFESDGVAVGTQVFYFQIAR